MHRAARVELSRPGVSTYADGELVAPLPAVAECVPGALHVVGTARRADDEQVTWSFGVRAHHRQ